MRTDTQKKADTGKVNVEDNVVSVVYYTTKYLPVLCDFALHIDVVYHILETECKVKIIFK